MTHKDSGKFLLEEIYPKMQADVAGVLVETGGDLTSENRMFLTALVMLLSTLQMKSEAKLGATVVLKQFIEISGMDWDAFKKSAIETITQSAAHYSAPVEKTKDTK